MSETSSKQRKAVRTVALLEALKGLLALLAASGLLLFLHEDIVGIARNLVLHLHLNPAAHYPDIFIKAAVDLQNMQLLTLAGGAAAYSILRLLEAYGLYRERAWAEVLAAASGAIYLPFEWLGWQRHSDVLHAALLLINLAVVIFMLHLLRQRRRNRG